MLLEVPFIPQSTATDCGPACLRMVCQFFGVDVSREKAIELVRSEKAGFTWSIGIALAVQRLNLSATFYSKCIETTPETFERERLLGTIPIDESAEINVRETLRLCREHGVSIFEQALTLEELLSKLGPETLIISLIDYNALVGRQGYQGHFVVVVGYDEQNVIIHEPGRAKPTAYMKVPRDVFDRVRSVAQTDCDTVIVERGRGDVKI